MNLKGPRRSAALNHLSELQMTTKPICAGLVLDPPEISLACDFEHHDSVVVVDRAEVQEGVYDARRGETCLYNPEAIKRRTPIKSGA